MKNDNIIFLCKCNQFLIETVWSQHRRRIVRVGNNHKFRFLSDFLRNFLQINDVVIFFALRHIVKFRPRQRRTIRKDRITRIRHQNHIAFVHDRKRNVCQSLLGTKQGTNFRLRVQFYPVPARIPLRYRLQKRLLILNRVQIIFRYQTGFAERL